MHHRVKKLRVAAVLLAIAVAGLGLLGPGSSQPAWAAVTFTVGNTNDAGLGSLRQAILDANAQPGLDTITFNIPPSDPGYQATTGTWTIAIQGNLPLITSWVVIDGTTQPGYVDRPIIELTGVHAISEIYAGVYIDSSPHTDGEAGHTTVRGLVINGMRWYGILADGYQNVIERNYIGTDVTGTHAVPNEWGVSIAYGGRIADNLISGNSTNGIYMAFNNVIVGNKIGTDVTGDHALSRGSTGLENIQRVGVRTVGGDNNRIGGTTAAERNIIAGHYFNAIFLQGIDENRGTGNVIEGNYIGTDVTGTKAVGGGGIQINAARTYIRRNLISGNDGTGVHFVGVTTGSTVQGNFIGTDATGKLAIPNGAGGVYLDYGTSNITIGGTTPAARNVISGNQQRGVSILPYYRGAIVAQGHVVEGNFIGVDVTGITPLPNAGGGVGLGNQVENTTIGGTAAGAGNVIAGNNGNGVEFLSVYGSGNNVVHGNFIGTGLDATSALGNLGEGVLVSDGNDVTVGGTAPGEGNTIAFNMGNGVSLVSPYAYAGLISFSMSVRGNAIFSNGKLGIDLDKNGVTLNDTGDADNGSNHLQNFPELVSVTSSGGRPTITGTLNSTPLTIFDLDFYANSALDPSGYGEGERFLGSQRVTTDTSGNVTFSAPFTTLVAAGQFVTATATDPNRNTSEFSFGKPVTTSDTSCATSQWSAEGNANDIFGANPGTLENGATFAPGKVGQGFSLDGINDFVDIPMNTPSLNSPVSFTWDAWINPQSLNYPVIFGKEANVFNRAGLQIFPNGALCSYMNSSHCSAISAGGLMQIGKFTRVTMLYDAATRALRTYVDGNQVSSASISLPYNNTAHFRIGVSPVVSYNSHFQGVIDEVTISACALPPNGGPGGGPGPTPGQCNATSSTVSLWLADGNANDSVGSNNGTLENGAAFGPGVSGQAFSLDGVNDFVDVPNNASLNPCGSFTWDAWINPTSLANHPVVMTKESGVFNRIGLQVRSNGAMCGYFDNDHCDATSPACVVKVGTFTHVAMVYDQPANEMRLYANGTLVAVGAKSAPPSISAAALTFGTSPLFGKNFYGLIDDVGLQNFVLSENDILTIYSTNVPANNPTGSGCNVNQTPVVNAGAAQTVNEGSLVTLDGTTSSDPDGDPLTYSWTQRSGTPVTLSDPYSAQPTFTAPEVPSGGATLTFQLTVNDGHLDSASDTVDITVTNVNHTPVVNAGAAQTVNEGSLVTLNGSASFDPDGDPLTYSWLQTAGPAVTLSDPAAVQPTFTAPFVGPAGVTCTFQLTVSDGLDSASKTVNVVVENINHTSIANAGPDQTKNEGSLVTLDGTASSDPDGDPLTYSWTQLSGTPVTLSDPHSATPTFTTPLEPSHSQETLTFQLIVKDGVVSSTPDAVAITVVDIDAPPACGLAQASAATLWPPNHKLVAVAIVGATDPDNDQMALTVTGVTQDEPVNGLGDGDTSPDAVIQGAQVQLRAERSGQGNGRVYQVRFTADDGFGGRCTGSVTVCVPHDQKPGTSCVDDGQLYDATQR